jgi:hypothetical protein
MIAGHASDHTMRIKSIRDALGESVVRLIGDGDLAVMRRCGEVRLMDGECQRRLFP